VNFREIESDEGCQNREGVFSVGILVVFATSHFSNYYRVYRNAVSEQKGGVICAAQICVQYSFKNTAGA
jgi:hypothetical protein